MTDQAALRRRRVTAAEVAEAAGVSRSAVSRAFTPGSYIDPDKRAAVMRAATELGYRPNALAAGLSGARSHLVAVFMGEMPNEYDREVVEALVGGLNRIGTWPIVIAGPVTSARDAVADVLRFPLEAMILRSGSLDEAVLEACAKLAIPVISSGRLLDRPGVDTICVRNREGMAKAARLMVERGRRRVCYIGGPDSFGASDGRRQGMTEALAAAGLSPVAVVAGDFSVSSGYRAAQEVLAVSKLDAMICANDAMAIGALSALAEAGLSVPGDVSVTGFDDMAMAAWPAFGLTTVRNPVPALVEGVTGLLERRLAEPHRPEETIRLDADLVLRRTH
ncbi:MAG: LacI family DNA-binding transcriptional regulator [Pseudomonadota bacterium]